MLDISVLNDLRQSQGLLTIDQVLDLNRAGNMVYDPFSALISAGIKIGTGNILYPCVSLLTSASGALHIGDNNIFHSNSLMKATAGPISIGSSNQFGEGGLTVKTDREGAAISIGDGGRYSGGAAVYGLSHLGSGSQLLGGITLNNCTLEQGDGFHGPDPGRRAGLLKGFGNAQDLVIPQGHVINGEGHFDLSELKRQSFYHPKV